MKSSALPPTPPPAIPSFCSVFMNIQPWQLIAEKWTFCLYYLCLSHALKWKLILKYLKYSADFNSGRSFLLCHGYWGCPLLFSKVPCHCALHCQKCKICPATLLPSEHHLQASDGEVRLIYEKKVSGLFKMLPNKVLLCI